MEENVALDSKKQKKFVQSIRGIKKLIKKNEGKTEPQKKDEQVEPKKPFSMRLKGGKINKKKRRKERGLVYLSHIPHGFYEHQMTQYFKQFGVVTNARVIRSKRTGNSKGFAFVEFKEPAVGQIVAETMNNYLMGKRLIKAAYIPPEKQRRAFRKHWNSINNPTSQLRIKSKKEFNTDKDDVGELKRARRLMSNLNKNKKKLSEVGINYDFFAPVDVPEALLNDIVKQENQDNSVKQEIKPKQAKTGKQEQTGKQDQTADKKESSEHVKKSKETKGKKNEKVINSDSKKKSQPADDKKKVQNADSKKKLQNADSKKKLQNVDASANNGSRVNRKEKAPVEFDEKVQKEKEEKLKKAGVKPPSFIKVENDSGEESDCSYEYDKLLEKDSEQSAFLSDDDDESEADNASDDVSDTEDDAATESSNAASSSLSGEESDDDEEVPPKKARGRPQTKRQQAKKQEQKKPVQVKRKVPHKHDVSPKKAKFEKQGQKPMKKQFKKK